MERTYLCRKCHAPRRKQATAGDSGGHHAEFTMFYERIEVLDLFLEGGVLDVLRLVWIGGLATGICVAEGSHLRGLGD